MTIEQLLAMRATHERTIGALRAAIGAGVPTAEQSTQLRAARDAIVSIDDELDQRQREQRAANFRAELGRGRGVGGAHVTREPRTYGPGSERSFFADALASRLGNPTAAENLARAEREALDGQQRAIGTSNVGGMVVPQYLLNLAAPVLRSGRPFVNSIRHEPLPEQGMSLLVPRGTTGASVGAQATENTSLLNVDEAWTPLTVPVVTVGGQQDVSRQILDRGDPAADRLILNDLLAAWSAEVERQAINGSGASGNLLGALQTAGIGTATAFGAAVTAASFFTKIAGSIAAIGASSALDADAILLHPRRWAWLCAQTDSTGRPLVAPGAGANSIGSNAGQYSANLDDENLATPVGTLSGLNVYTSSQVPTNMGSGSAEDVAVVYDSDQLIFWEPPGGQPMTLQLDQVLAGQLSVKMVLFAYSAFTAGRYPTAVARVGGADPAPAAGATATGMQPPAF